MPKRQLPPPDLKDVFDTHFHIQPEDVPTEMVARANAAGVSRMLVAGAKVGDAEAMLERIDGLVGVYAAVGIHPHEAEKFDGDVDRYRKLVPNPQVKAKPISLMSQPCIAETARRSGRQISAHVTGDSFLLVQLCRP